MDERSKGYPKDGRWHVVLYEDLEEFMKMENRRLAI